MAGNWELNVITAGAFAVALTTIGFLVGRASVIQSSAAEGGIIAESLPLSSSIYNGQDCKLTLVVRTDLGMSKGKAAAQCCHAALACYKTAIKQDPDLVRYWDRRCGQAKITLQAKSEDDLLLLQAKAMSLGITACLIHDAGRTQIAAGSATVLGLGPAPKSLLDQVTGSLKLY